MSIGQLVFAYPARRIAIARSRNITLHLSVVLGIALQLLTIYVTPLRLLLGLQLPETFGLVWVAGAVAISWGVAELYSWRSKVGSQAVSINNALDAG
jgi:hypothetical protein